LAGITVFGRRPHPIHGRREPALIPAACRDIGVLLRQRIMLCGLGGIVSLGWYRDAQVLLRLSSIMGADLALNRGVLRGLGGIVSRYSTGNALMFLRRGAMLLRLSGIMGTDVGLNRVG